MNPPKSEESLQILGINSASRASKNLQIKVLKNAPPLPLASNKKIAAYFHKTENYFTEQMSTDEAIAN